MVYEFRTIQDAVNPSDHCVIRHPTRGAARKMVVDRYWIYGRIRILHDGATGIDTIQARDKVIAVIEPQP